jgi:hypothetical protein
MTICAVRANQSPDWRRGGGYHLRMTNGEVSPPAERGSDRVRGR